MATQLLGYALVRSLAGTRRPGTVPPVALVVRVDPAANLTAPGTLLRRCVSITASTHPILDALLHDAGAHLDHGSYLLPAPAGSNPTPAVVTALAAPHPGVWRAGARADVPTTLGSRLVAALTTAGAAPGAKRPRRLAGQTLAVTRVGSRLRITPSLEVPLEGRVVPFGGRGRMLLTPTEALEVVTAARGKGMVVLDGQSPGRFADVERLADHGCILVPVPGAPAWAQFHTGRAVTPPSSRPVPAAAALDLAAKLPAEVKVASHPAVTDAAAVARLCDPRTRRRTPARPQLRPWQDVFVSAYLAAGAGLVNALPPGAGKTVCAAAAMADRAGLGGRYRAVVLAPATVRAQWARELARFFPAAEVRVLETSAQLPSDQRTWDRTPEPMVWVLTPQMLARTGALQTLRTTDLVVDEAVFLAGASAQTQAAWRLRQHADHAMVLTGTPDQRGHDGTGALLAFARGRRDLFADLPLSAPHPTVAGDPAGDLIFTGPDTVAGQLPDAAPAPLQLTPGPLERAIDRAAADRVGSLLAAPRVPVPRLRAELEAWRLGLASPAALLSSRYALAEAVRADAEAGSCGAEVGVKCRWVLDRVRDTVAAGGQLLVFSDFTLALDACADQLAAAGVKHAVVSSAVPARLRDAAVAAFTAGDIPVLLVAATGQLGLNLQRAATVLHLDVPTTAAVLRQRGARAARLGSDHPRVDVVVPVLAGCADEQLLDLLLAGALPGDTRQLAQTLTAGARSHAA